MRTSKITKLSTKAVRRWLITQDYIPAGYKQRGFRLEDLDIDHLLPTSLGGMDHPYNYNLVPKGINNEFGSLWTAEKLTYLGAQNAMKRKAFLCWRTTEAEHLGIDYNAFDKIWKRHSNR